jgi:hypothetical protein
MVTVNGNEKVDEVVKFKIFPVKIPHDICAGTEHPALLKSKSGGNLIVKKENKVELALAMFIKRLLLESKAALLNE